MGLFPEIEPHEGGSLEVGDGQSLYWEICGNPSGTPALVLHGGPGSGCTSGMRRMFDPDLYRIVLFDQRGCGRSTPRVDALTDLSDNTTWHLVSDIELLRRELDVRRWVVFGLSWGVTLALAYAENHPDRVGAMVLASVTMTTPREIHRLYHELGRDHPGPWRRFQQFVPEAERGSDLVVAYNRLLNAQPDVNLKEGAARAWCD
ncbi:MAG: alpha/beta fold hydrolase, partial [Acidimicrobiales bacterium]